MKSIVVETFGPPETFELKEVPTPTPPAGHVLIDVKAAGISFVDLLVAQGLYQVKPPLPYPPGTEFSGIVSEVGDGVNGIKVGDHVIAGSMAGGFSEKCLVPAEAATVIPDDMDFAHASVFRVSYSTAYHGLVQRAELKAGETVLVLGAAGAIGTACIQVAKALGATVIASASTDAKRQFTQTVGADHAIDTHAEDWRDQIKALTNGKGVNVVVDPVGGDVTEKAFRSLAWRGRHLVIGYAEGTIPKLPVNLALLKGAALVGVDYRQFGIFEAELAQENLEELIKLYSQGKVTPPIAATHALEDYAPAMQSVIDGSALGRVVLTP